ncbi:MAG: hypothetical protein ACW7DS_15490 [Paraglaciecola chathamensis]
MFKIFLLVFVLAAIAYFIYPKSPEAREWLISNNNKHALAGNRFASTQCEREAIFNIANQEASNQGMAFNPESDVINNKLLLWWD